MRRPSRLLLLLLCGLVAPAGSTHAEDEEGVIDGETMLERAGPLVRDLYLHPDAIQPAAMVRAGVQALEHLSPRLLVTESDGAGLLLEVGGQARALRVDSVASLDEALVLFEQACQFVHPLLADPEISLEDLRAATLSGALHTIDRHSTLIAGDRLDDFNTRFQGTLVGIGARIGRRDDGIRVIKPFPSAPAGRAGLEAWDFITHIDGVPTDVMGVDDAVERIRGPEGVPVVLTVQRREEAGPRVFVIVRANVLVPSVEFSRLEGDVGYVNIDHFSKRTSEEFVEALAELSGVAPLRGVIVDLRGNQGGSMVHAARIVNHFVADGMLVQTEGRGGARVAGLTWKIPAQSARKGFDGPVVVLVDGQTASGSEIVAGGLKFLGRSLTIGSQTFGKGTVQKVYELADDASLKLTVARYLLPGERYINFVGVTPDVMTGELWLEPGNVAIPDELREPYALLGLDEGPPELDERKNPGAGRPPTVEGVNAGPELRLLSVRVLDAWRLPTPAEATATGTAEGEPRPGTPPGEATEATTPEVENISRSLRPGTVGDTMFNDLELRLAWDVLREAKPGDQRAELLGIARPLVEAWQAVESAGAREALALRQIPWTATPLPRWLDRAPALEPSVTARLRGEPPALQSTLELPETFTAGTEGVVRLVVKNPGAVTYPRLRAWLESSDPALDGAAFLLGDLVAGGERSAEITVRHGTRDATRRDVWRLYLIDDDGPLGGPFRGVVGSVGVPVPALAVRLRTTITAEDRGGILMTATIEVRNEGPGEAGEVRVQFGDPGDPRVESRERFATLGAVAEGGRQEATLTLRVRDPEAVGQLAIRLRAVDARTGGATTAAVTLPTGADLPMTDWFAPARISFSSLPGDGREAPVALPSPLQLRGEVRAADPLRFVEVFVGGDKLFSEQVAEGQPTRVLPFAASAPLGALPEIVVVRVTTAAGVSSSAERWVLSTAAIPAR